MKKIISMLLLLWSLSLFSETGSGIGTRCPICIPSISGVPDGYVLLLSSGSVSWGPGGGGGGSFWPLTGATGTNPTTDFMGTTDGTRLTIKSIGVNDNKNPGLTIESTNTTGVGVAIGGIGIGVGLVLAGVSTSNTDPAISITGTSGDVSQPDIFIRPSHSRLQLNNLNEGLNKVLTSNTAGYANWQFLFGTPILDSVATSGGSISLSGNSSYIITSASGITDLSLTFPSGDGGGYILIVFNQHVATLTYTGSGSGTLSPLAPLAGTSKVYLNIGGNWY